MKIKTETLVLVIIAFCVVSLLYAIPPCAWYEGTYVNVDYDNKGIMAKFTIDGCCDYKIYEKTTSPNPIWKGENYTSDRWWSDDGKYMFIRIWMQNEDGSSYYGLFIFSDGDAGMVMETVWSETDYPNEINVKDRNYRIYFWQKRSID